ncbi:MAG: hypothetical protein ACOZNI_00535 [Myxococcota bacterium]
MLALLIACAAPEPEGRSPIPRDERPDLRPDDTTRDDPETTPPEDDDVPADTDTTPPEDTDTTPPPDEGGGGGGGPCEFPQGLPDEAYVAWAGDYEDTDPTVDDAVNEVMEQLSGCSSGSDCDLSALYGAEVNEACQRWFGAVTAELRVRGYCAGQHVVGETDEIAVSATGCEGRWYGYHVCYYGGPKVVWNPGARRGWWQIDPAACRG